MRRPAAAELVFLLLLAVGAGGVALLGDGAWFSGTADRDPDPEAPPLPSARAITDVLGPAEVEGFHRVTGPRPFVFPEDHGPHPRYRIEWWYLTGNLEGEGGRPFGYQLTFFRSALSPQLPEEGSSSWRTDQAWMAHFAVTDPEGGGHHAFERFSRQALELAGARADPFRVWVEDWEIRGTEGDTFPLRLDAGEGEVAVSLTLDVGKGRVLQGEDGFSRKGPEAGNASHYYSYPRMPTRGILRLGADTLTVEGLSWMDREWGTSTLGEGQVGWDWFALQLDDGRDLMYYRLRREDGSEDPLSRGIVVEADGSSRTLRPEEVELEVLEWWTSRGDGTRYPVRWRLSLPGEDLRLEVLPLVRDQEMRLAFRYWEGAVRVQGRAGDRSVGGRGYLELTGYGEGVTP